MRAFRSTARVLSTYKRDAVRMAILKEILVPAVGFEPTTP